MRFLFQMNNMSIISNIKNYLNENGILYGFLESGGLNVC